MKYMKRTSHLLEDFELPFQPDSIMEYKDFLVQEVGPVTVIGYLSHDDDCPNPLEDCDGMGRIYSSSRHAHHGDHYEMQKALGLNSSWGPDLDLVDEADLVKEAHHRLAQASRGEGLGCVIFAEVLAFCKGTYQRDDDQTDLEFVCSCLDTEEDLSDFNWDWVEVIQISLWNKGREEGTIGNPYAVSLDVYEHGGVSYSLSGQGMQCDFDTARGGALWVPDKYCLEHINSQPEAERRAEAVKCAETAAEEYTKWCNGECFGHVVITFNTATKERLTSDECWGYIGGDYAYSRLQEEFNSTVSNLQEEGKQQPEK